MPTVMCDRECEDVVMDGYAHSHNPADMPAEVEASNFWRSSP